MAPKKRTSGARKNLQVRLGAQAHDTLKYLAQERGKSIADIIREALEIYSIGVTYAAQGKQLIWEDRETGAKTVVLIPGFTAPPAVLLSDRILGNTEH